MKHKKLLMVLALFAAGCNAVGEQPFAEVVDRALAGAERQALRLAEKYQPLEGRLPRTWEQG